MKISFVHIKHSRMGITKNNSRMANIASVVSTLAVWLLMVCAMENVEGTARSIDTYSTRKHPSLQDLSRRTQTGRSPFVAKANNNEDCLLGEKTATCLATDVASMVRGGGDGIGSMVVEATQGLQKYMKGAHSDALMLLSTTALNTPVSQALKISPILGFLLTGLVVGPKGFNLISDVHKTEHIADLGVVLFLFEMGVHLSLDTLWKLRQKVFGLGGGQFGVTAAVIALLAKFVAKQSTAASVVIGGSLALSSSAFVLQLLKDTNEMESDFGKSSFAILLLQDLMVVPLLVITPLLAPGGDASVGRAVAKAVVQLLMALTFIGVFGSFALNPLMDFVAGAKDQNCFVGVILATIFGLSMLTEGLGLSNTLGAFLAGMMLSTNPHVHAIEREVAPIRGILVGLFFFTVGFEIDLNLIASQPLKVGGLVAGILSLKAIICTALAAIFGLGKATSPRVGLILSQAGEFAFVAFRMARSFGILDASTTNVLLTITALTMAVTPFVERVGYKVEQELKKNKED